VALEEAAAVGLVGQLEPVKQVVKVKALVQAAVVQVVVGQTVVHQQQAQMDLKVALLQVVMVAMAQAGAVMVLGVLVHLQEIHLLVAQEQ
jgi:tetrahydromethanopterin S-methyltransferase subunit C